MKYETVAPLLEMIISAAVKKGWTNTHASYHENLGGEEPGFAYSYIYPKKDENSINSICVPSYHFDANNHEQNLARVASHIDNIPVYSEWKLGELFNAIEQVKVLGEANGISAAVLNPITILADQLRTNILPAPKD